MNITAQHKEVHITLSCNQQQFLFSAYNTYSNSFEKLATALLMLAEQKHTHSIIEFNLESEGMLYMLISSYPMMTTRISCYKNIDWESYEEVFEQQPLPQPVFDAIIESPYYFIRHIIKQLKTQGKDAYSSWDHDFFDTTLPLIEQLIHLKV